MKTIWERIAFYDKCKCIDCQMEIAEIKKEYELKENILPVCTKCTKEEHEGYFCRCEGRNIQLAKKFRLVGKKAWQ